MSEGSDTPRNITVALYGYVDYCPDLPGRPQEVKGYFEWLISRPLCGADVDRLQAAIAQVAVHRDARRCVTFLPPGGSNISVYTGQELTVDHPVVQAIGKIIEEFSLVPEGTPNS